MIGPIALIREMPEGYEQACFDTGAIERKRGVKTPGELMLLNLIHLINGCSLMEISEIARLGKFGELSDVAFMKRFKNSNEWFKWIIRRLQSDGYISYKKPKKLENYRIVAVDATDVKEKGRSQRIFRLHFALDIYDLKAYQYQITTNKTGESLMNFEFAPNDLIIADRVYGTIHGIEHCLQRQSQYVLRLRSKAFSMYDKSGNKIDLMKEIQRHEHGSIEVYLNGETKSKARVCFKRKTPEAIEQTQKRLKDRARKSQKKVTEEAKAFNEYIVLITSLPDEIADDDIMELYRFRWQIELFFKRLKSIMDYGELPKKTSDSIFSWLNGKLMIALLVEKMMSKGSFFPQAEFPPECLERDEDDLFAFEIEPVQGG